MADARVDSSLPNVNYGNSTYLRLRDAPGSTFESYIRVGVNGVSGSVSSAKLRVFAYIGSDSAGSVYPVPGSWSEMAITYNNAPPITGTPLDTEGIVGSGQWVEFDVSAVVTGNGVYNFGLASNSASSVYYRSREASQSQKPELVIQFGP